MSILIYLFLIISIIFQHFYFKNKYKNLFKVLSKQQEINKNNLSIKADLLQTEIQLLRAQINPHFIFNTLNILYHDLLEKTPNSAVIILKLSDLMRYSVESTQQSLVPLNREIKAIEDFLAIQQSRFQSNYNVIYFCSIKKDSFNIPPMTILTIIENIFKYGVINNISNPIKIYISLKDNVFRFESSNQIRKDFIYKETKSVGLKNLLKRLDNYYGDDSYRYKFSNTHGKYTTFLEINLQNKAA